VSPSPQQIAERHLERTGALWNPPPAMVVSVGTWMDSIFAGHVLATVEHDIVKAKGFIAPLKEKNRYLKGWLQNVSSELKRLQPGKNIRIHRGLDPAREYMGMKKIDAPAWGPAQEEDLFLFKETRGKRLTFGNHHDPYLTKYTLEEAADFMERKLRYQIKANEDIITRLETSGDNVRDAPTLVELLLLRRECLKHTFKAKHYKSKTKKDFQIDLTGWEYVQSNAPLIRSIRNKMLSKITLAQSWVAEREEAEAFAKVIERKIRSGEYPKQEEGEAVSAHTRRVQVAIHADTSAPKHLAVVKATQAWREKGRATYLGFPDLDHNYISLQEGKLNLVELEKKRSEYESISAEEILKAGSWGAWDTITATLDFKGHLQRGGQWSPGRRLLEVDVSAQGITTVANFKRTLAEMHDVLWHELQHVGQDLLRALHLMDEDAGLPSKSIRDPDVDPSGYPTGPLSRGRIQHELRDVEFQTDLGEAIRDFIRSLNRVPKLRWREHLEQTVGIKGYSPHNRYFRTWKRKAPGKWKKAVAEFVKEVENRVDIPGASDIRRIAVMHSRDLEQLAQRIERLARTRTHGWHGGDDLEFENRLPNSRVRDPRRKLPDPARLRELAKQRERSEEDEKWVSSNWRMWIQTAMTLEGLVRDNDPRNPRRIMRDMAWGRHPMASLVSSRYLKK